MLQFLFVLALETTTQHINRTTKWICILYS